MPNLINFDYNTNVIRTQVTEDGEPLFCLADICKVLGVSDPSNTARQVAEEFSEHPVLNTDSLITIPTDTGYGIKDLIYLTEPQAYAFLPQAEDLSRIDAAVTLLEYTLPKAFNQGEPD